MKDKFHISLSVKFAMTFAVLFLAAMIVVTFIVHRTVTNQFMMQYNRSVNAAVESINDEISSRHNAVQLQLDALADKIADDNTFRLELVSNQNPEATYIVNYAENYMSTMGLQSLEIINRDGIAISLGQYKTAFGTSRENLLSRLQQYKNNITIGGFQRPTGNFPCLTGIDSVMIGGEYFYVIGGLEINSSFLKELLPNADEKLVAQFSDNTVSSTPLPVQPELLYQIQLGDTLDFNEVQPPLTYSMGKINLQYLTNDSVSTAGVFLFHSTSDLMQLIDGLNQRIFSITGIIILLAILMSIWRAHAVVKPLRRLANIARNFSFTNLDTTFNVQSNDEVGVLNNALQEMVYRLRQNHWQLAKAEQKVALAEITRQVNHDVRNGIIPIRNVMRHWEEVESEEPEKLSEVFSERKSTIMDSLEYLQQLTESYSKLQPVLNVQKVSIADLVQKLYQHYQNLPGQQINFICNRDKEDLVVQADEVQLRRAFENIIRNALDAIEDEGTITLTCKRVDGEALVQCKDDGKGIPEYIQRQLFNKPISTKPEGTGIGLTNAKRIIEDFEGWLTMESEENRGTTVTIRLPLVSPATN